MMMREERVSSMEGPYDHLATRADVQELRGEMRAITAELVSEIRAATERLESQIESSKQELLAEFASEIRASEIRIIKWGVGMATGVALGMLASIAAMLRLLA